MKSKAQEYAEWCSIPPRIISKPELRTKKGWLIATVSDVGELQLRADIYTALDAIALRDWLTDTFDLKGEST